MGCFGYICKGCGTSIRGDCFKGGEKCVMIHVRHGVEIGRVEGHYDEYGRVFEEKDCSEDEKFRGFSQINPNSHNEICESEFEMDDSYFTLQNLRIYHGAPVDYFTWFNEYIEKLLFESDFEIEKLPFYEKLQVDEMCLNIFKKSLIQMKEAQATGDEETLELTQRLVRMFGVSLCKSMMYEPEIENEFYKLPMPGKDGYSGIVAYHSHCYKKAIKDMNFNLVPSDRDPNQSSGRCRKKYM